MRDEPVGTIAVYCNNEVLFLSAFPNVTLIVGDLALISCVTLIESSLLRPLSCVVTLVRLKSIIFRRVVKRRIGQNRAPACQVAISINDFFAVWQQ